MDSVVARWLSLIVTHMLLLWGQGVSLQSLGSRLQRLSTQHMGSLIVIQAALQHVGPQFLDQG